MKLPNPIKFITSEFRRYFVLMTFVSLLFWVYESEFQYKNFSFFKRLDVVEYKIYPPKKNTGNQEAIEIVYNLFVKDGYTKDMSEFVKLMDTNAEAKSHAYLLFRRGGYKKSMSAFDELMGVKNNTINEEYLKGAFESFGGEEKLGASYEVWRDKIKNNEEYKTGMFNHFGGEKKLKASYDIWNSKVFGVKSEIKKVDTEVKTKKRYKTRYLIKFRALYPKNAAFWHNIIAIPLFFWATKPLIKTSKNKRLTSGIVLIAYVLVCILLTRYLDYYEILT